MENIEIFDMTLEDFEKIKDTLISDFDDFWSPSILKSELIGDNKKYIAAKNKNKIVGFAGMMINFQELEIMNIVTKKTERGKGIGKILLQEIIKFAKNNEIEKIFLEVNENNIIARKLYKKQGFEEIGVRKNYYDGQEIAIIMSKNINIL